MKPLSIREQQVIELLAGGLTQKEVACKMGISRRTVSCYLYRVRIKTDQPTILAAVIYSITNGLVLINSA